MDFLEEYEINKIPNENTTLMLTKFLNDGSDIDFSMEKKLHGDECSIDLFLNKTYI